MDSFVSLSQTVGASMRPAAAVSPEESLARAAAFLRESHAAFLPVTEGGRFVGGVTEASLASAVEQGLSPLLPLSHALIPDYPSISVFSSGADALRRLSGHQGQELAVVDADGRLLGLISVSDLFPRYESMPQLPLVGGMATPFGVYLTTAGVMGGAGHLALISTGMMLFAVFLLTAFAGEGLAMLISQWFGLGKLPLWVYSGLQFLLFLGTVRLLPLSGTHAAEHKVVHALEWGEPLEAAVVKRMPRVHPRCGTNLAVAASLFLGLAQWKWTPYEEVRMLVALVVTLALWRPLGSLVQQYITTKTPTDAQIEGGIRSAKDLIQKCQNRGTARASFLQRLIASGMLHVITGSTLMLFIAEGIAQLFGKTLGL